MSYLDIDTVLSEEDRFPCIFQSDAKSLAFLDPTLVQDVDLPKFSRIELPLWLASSLSDRHMVKVEIPKYFGSKMRDELMADAASINLREFSNYFFEIGLKLCQITKDDDLMRTLRIAFCGDRFRSLLVRSFSSGHTEKNADFSQSLTSKELQIYRLGVATSEEIHEWKTRQSFIMQKSSLLRRRSVTGNDGSGSSSGGGDDENDRKRQAI